MPTNYRSQQAPIFVVASLPPTADPWELFVVPNGGMWRWDGSAWVIVGGDNTRMGQVLLSFGAFTGSQHNLAHMTVSAPWVEADSIILCQSGAITTADHDAEDAVIESIQARAINIIPGVSFDIEAYAPGGTNGSYYFIYLGQVSPAVVQE